MNFKPILIVAGSPKSIFLEIFFKSLDHKKYKKPLVLICSKKLLIKYMVKRKIKKKIKVLEKNSFKITKLDNKSINLIDIEYKKNDSQSYIENSFNMAFRIIKKGITDKLINGPVSKSKFLKGVFPGMTEYISSHFNVKNNAMLIFNENLSVCPVTTHLPIREVSKNISKKIIKDKIILVDKFYRKILLKKPNIAVLGLNPHCETFGNLDEDNEIIKPVISSLNKKIKISGPYPADTIFLKNNRKKFDVIIGMYHDQVLTPLKSLFEYDAINITLGLPFIRVSPDHGPNEKMIDKNKSDPESLIKAISFLDKN